MKHSDAVEELNVLDVPGSFMAQERLFKNGGIFL